MIDVYAADEQHEVTLDLERWSRLCRHCLEDEGVRGLAEVSLIFIDDVAIATLNQEFMGKSGPTDVLSFPIEPELAESGRSPDAGSTGPGENAEPEMPVLVGDIVICPAVASRQAPDNDHTLEDELALLVVHGVLHLRGWDHEEDAEAERMESRERELLERHYRSSAP